ncbi:hypothetical protein [Escherichia phage vB_EcoM_JNE01]|nr:hypothetical protein [Escherichia phage vB_EcoM_JNE01]
MKVITQTQAYSLMLLYMDDLTSISRDLNPLIRGHLQCEIRMLAVLGTNFQLEYVEEYLYALKRYIAHEAHLAGRT